MFGNYFVRFHLPYLICCLDAALKMLQHDAMQSNASDWWSLCLHSIWGVDLPMRRNLILVHLEREKKEEKHKELIYWEFSLTIQLITAIKFYR